MLLATFKKRPRALRLCTPVELSLAIPLVVCDYSCLSLSPYFRKTAWSLLRNPQASPAEWVFTALWICARMDKSYHANRFVRSGKIMVYVEGFQESNSHGPILLNLRQLIPGMVFSTRSTRHMRTDFTRMMATVLADSETTV